MSYRDLNTCLRETFGGKVWKISLSAPFTCPNRDGTLGEGGCIFCSGKGSGDFAPDPSLPVGEQLAAGKALLAKKAGDSRRYIAYFQSFTSTYGPLDVQRRLFTGAIGDPEVVALSIATRPDCLPDGVLDLLEELRAVKPVWVELGFQTSREDTAASIGRAYPNAVFEKAVRDLKARSIAVIVHLILGLPGEDHSDEINTVRYVCEKGIDGLKFHLLHVLSGTKLAETDYLPLSLDEYVFRVTDLLRYVPRNVVIHRLTGDGDKRELIAPLWSADKKRVRNAIASRIRKAGIEQGEALSPGGGT